MPPSTDKPGTSPSAQPRTLPEPGLRTRSDFLRKLSYYLAGIAIGCILLGVFHSLREQERKRRIAERAAQINAPQAPNPFFPPTPTQQRGASDAAPAASGDALPPAQAPAPAPEQAQTPPQSP